MSGQHGANPRIGRRSCRSSLLAAGALLGLASTPALAQTLDSGSGVFASQKLSGAPGADYGAPPIPQPEALVPQVNQYLHQYGTAVLLDNVDEFDGIITGREKGSANAGQYGLEWDQDWNTLAGIPGLQTHAIAVGRYGIPTSRIFGDNINPSQEIYGAGGNVAIHLVFFYAEETAAHGHVALAVGRFPSQNDFDSNPLNCNFQNNSLCGNAKAVGDNVSNSSYPDANWAARLRVRPISQVYVESGIYFTQDNIYNATGGFRSGFGINSSHINGEFFPAEIGWEPTFGPDKLPGHYKLGASYDNNNHTTWGLAEQTGLTRKGGSQAWAQFDQMLVRQGPGATDGIIVTGDFVHNDERYSTRGNEYVLAGIDRNFWHARPFDTIGLLVAYTQVSSNLTNTQRLEQEFGLPLSGGFVNNSLPPGVQTHTINLEANYQIHVFRGVTFAPDFQYFFRPNAQGNLPDAALIGFKSHIELF